MSTDVEAFDLACQGGDIDRVRSLVEDAGFEAYLYVDQIWKTIFDTAQDPLFEWLVDYIRRHPLNRTVLAGGLYRRSQCQILQYRLYIAVRDSHPIDTVYDLMSEFTEVCEDIIRIDVALVVRLVHIPPPVSVVEALREFLLERKLERIQDFEMWDQAEKDRYTSDEIVENRTLDHVEVLWRYVDENFGTEHDHHRRHWAQVQGADPEIRDRILRLMVSATHHWSFTRYQLLQSLLSAGYPDLHATISEEYRGAGLEVQLHEFRPRWALSPEQERVETFHRLATILRHKTTIPEASVTVEQIRRLLWDNTLAIDERFHSLNHILVIVLLYSAISHGARAEVRNIIVNESYTVQIDLIQDLDQPGQPECVTEVEVRRRPSPNYQRLQRYFDGHNRDVRAVVTSLDGDGILCRNVLGVVCQYLDN